MDGLIAMWRNSKSLAELRFGGAGKDAAPRPGEGEAPTAQTPFAGVIEEYAPRLTRFLEMRTGSGADAQDLAQEAYFRLCRVPHPELIRAPESYLFRIASNLANEFMIRKRAQPPFVDLEAAQCDDESDGGSFTSHLESRSEIDRLEALLSELPPLYQAVLILRKRDGYSHAEISERLSISSHTVHKYLSRALLRCRTLWADRYDH